MWGLVILLLVTGWPDEAILLTRGAGGSPLTFSGAFLRSVLELFRVNDWVQRYVVVLDILRR
jgi:hypothetical protein